MMHMDGNLALAYGALEAGVDFFSHYPGSPLNSVATHLRPLATKQAPAMKMQDSLNEHVALLSAFGASLCGARAMVVMKHVGLNIAADSLNYVGYAAASGGMVIVVGTDPGATCSTGEEDPHAYALQASLPLFEPSSLQRVRPSLLAAFEASEHFRIPVLLFLPARLCHHGDLLPDPVFPTRPPQSFRFEKDPARFTSVGAQAVELHRQLLARLEQASRNLWRTQTHFNLAAETLVITRGMTHGHAYEAIQHLELCEKIGLLQLEVTFPLNCEAFLNLTRQARTLIFIEDQDGFLEREVKMHCFDDLECRIVGKDWFPAYGEITYAQVESALRRHFDLPAMPGPALIAQEIPERPGTYCEGCPHRAAFYGLRQALSGQDFVLGGDIGCSSLPPHQPDWLFCMNAGIGMCQGMEAVCDSQSIVSTGGDGSFFHMGIISLLNAVMNRIDFLHVLLDNRTVAMTGHQESPTSVGSRVDVAGMLRAMGVDEVVEVSAFEPLLVAYRLRQLQAKPGVRVLWVQGDCALQPNAQTLERRKKRTLFLHNEKCDTCNECYEGLQCPAISRIEPGHRNLTIDMDRCMRCAACLDICPNQAIEVRE